MEAEEKRGGAILGDEMGLGKTTTATLLMMHRREGEKGNFTPPHRPKRPTSAPAGNLVIVPKAVLDQWPKELAASDNAFAKEGAVLIYHGPQRHALVPLLSKAQVVITTYATARNEWCRHSGKGKGKNARKSGPCPLYKLNWWRVITDEAHEFRKSMSKIVHSPTHSLLPPALRQPQVDNSASDVWSLFDESTRPYWYAL